ncbi:hypothetical protein SAMN04488074_13632 [Lentzea albidocapillata subsp. violacea]|uniref:Uncharacterized protein n=1 Tax=Lentzea albidocapillata subsp. violacea TaxID=128104 RepID=A0A1G9YYP8_9PSEU|nr:hypothetical protein SAMN04488074_13632 [Lentzea albidocapillata subsp. violacea]
MLGPDGFDSVSDVYRYGYCHALALTLNERTGWPIVGLYTKKHGHMDHFLVRRPDGLLLDVTGAHTDVEVLHAWGSYGEHADYHSVRPASVEQIWAEVNRDDSEDPGDVAQLSQEVADVLLALPCGDAAPAVAAGVRRASQLAAVAAPTPIAAALAEHREDEVPGGVGRVSRELAAELVR